MTKQKFILCCFSLFISLTTLGVQATPISFTGNITANATLNVPEDFADIQTAWDYLKDKRINTDAIVTIQVADGTYDYTSTIELKHPDGDKIQILGNITAPENCTINFSDCSTGLAVRAGNRLGLLNGFKFYGNNTVLYGILDSNNSYIMLGSKMIINNFTSVGIYASFQSTIFAPYVTSSYNGMGFQATHNSSIYCQYAIANNNTSNGFLANMDSFVDARNTTASNNAYDFAASRGSYVEATNVTSTTNRFSPTRGTIGNSRSWIQ